MSKAEEIIKKRLRKMLRGQASYVLEDNTINNAQKMQQMKIIEELMMTLNKAHRNIEERESGEEEEL